MVYHDKWFQWQLILQTAVGVVHWHCTTGHGTLHQVMVCDVWQYSKLRMYRAEQTDFSGCPLRMKNEDQWKSYRFITAIPLPALQDFTYIEAPKIIRNSLGRVTNLPPGSVVVGLPLFSLWTGVCCSISSADDGTVIPLWLGPLDPR